MLTCLRLLGLPLLLVALSLNQSYCQTPTTRKIGEKTATSARIPMNGVLSLPIEQFSGKIAVTDKTVIHITGRFDNPQNRKELSLYVYGVKHTATRNSGEFDLILDASKLSKGENLVKVRIEGDGVGQVAAQTSFFVYSKPPVRLIVPTAEKDFSQAITLAVEGEAGFKPKSAQFYKGGIRLISKASLVSAEWDVTKESEKDYPLWAEVMSETGEKYQIAPMKVSVPRRVRVMVPSKPIEVTPKTNIVEIAATFVEGVKPRSVNYILDGTAIGTVIKAPFDHLTTDIAEVLSGTHRIVVRVEDESGAKYESAEASLIIKNTALDKQREQDDKILKVQAAEEERIRKEWDTSQLMALRRRIVGRIPTKFRRGAGTVGRVNGLSVLTRTLSLNGRVVDQYEIGGEPLTVECFLRAGAGRISLLASAEGDAQASVKTAASVMKRLVEGKGLTPDWSMLDVIIGYSDLTTKLGGNSAGSANTTAMMSVALNLPADDSIAMTGAIGSDGSVMPVGGIYSKGKAAFMNPQIKTIILPDNPSNEQELNLLYQLRPELFASKRIILARTIDQVLRQTLIGYDEEKLKYAESKFISAANSFVKGEDAVALSDLKAAQKVTPENYTLQIWITAIEQAKEQREKP